MKPGKRPTTALAVLTLIGLVLSGCGTEHYVVGKSYINKTNGFSVQSPSDKDWFLELDGDMVKVRNNSVRSAYMGCAMVKDPGTLKVEEFTEKYLNDEFKKFTSPSNVKKHRMQVSGMPAYAIEFSGSFDYTPMQNVLVCVLGGAKAYVFTFVIPVLKYKEHRKSFMQFVQTLKVGGI